MTNAPQSARNPHTWLMALQASLFVALFWPTWVWMAERFDASDSFYGHGWLVPIAFAWLIRQRRAILNEVPHLPTTAGLSWLIGAVGVHLLAWHLRIGFVSGFAMIAVLASLIWVNGGREALRVLRFPLAFLIFMVPLPGVFLIGISFHMKLLAATLATHIISWLGISAVQAGSSIHLPGVTIIVDDVCSGLRSVMSLAALSVLWASFLPPGAHWWKRAALVASALPIALTTNMVRILVLMLLAVIYGAPAAEGFVHFGSGIVVFGLAIVLLAVLSRLLMGKSHG